MLNRRDCGAAVEVAARRHLERAGLRWLASNVCFRGGELDLVMYDVMSVVFVEVRYRQQESHGVLRRVWIGVNAVSWSWRRNCFYSVIRF